MCVCLMAIRKELAKWQKAKEQGEEMYEYQYEDKKRALAIAIWYAVSALAFFALVVAAIWLAKDGVQ